MMRQPVDGKEEGKSIPVPLTEVYALGEQVRSNRGRVIQRHLLEAKTRDEEYRGDEILTLGHTVYADKRECCRRGMISYGAFEGTNPTHLT